MSEMRDSGRAVRLVGMIILAVVYGVLGFFVGRGVERERWAAAIVECERCQWDACLPYWAYKEVRSEMLRGRKLREKGE